MKKLALGAAVAVLAVSGVVPVAQAARGGGGDGHGAPGKAGRACAGELRELLRENNAVRDAAKRRINWADADPTGAGIEALGLEAGSIRIELGDTARIPLGRLITMHRRQPATFAWCDQEPPTTSTTSTTIVEEPDGEG